MPGGMARDSRIPGDPHDVLAMVFARPQEALRAARAMLAGGSGPYESSIARQALGILHREFGDLDAAIGELRQAVRLARRAGSPDREADVLATLGIALLQRGRTRQGLSALDEAAATSGGTTRARVLFRRAGARWILGRHRDALDDLRLAVPALTRARDIVWAARALTLRGHVHLALGSVRLADADFGTAQGMFATTDQEHDSVVAVQNRGVVAFRSGDLPAALELLDEADRRFRELGTPMFDLAADRCAVLLAAGLARDALEQADRALLHLARLHGQPTMRAELLLIAARAALLAGDPGTARRRADEARRLFGGQRRAWWAEHARLILVQAALAEDGASARLLAAARRLAARLAELGSPEVWQAHLLAGRTALELGNRRAADHHLGVAAEARHRGPAASRAAGWLAEALRAQAAGRPRRLLHACRAGLALIEEHRLTFGSAELRARATAQGAELAELAQRHWARSGGARELLAWTERWRATALTALSVPAVRPPEDPELFARLAALRETDHLLDRARSDGAASAATLERDRERLESQVRELALRVRGPYGREEGAPGAGRILAALGDDPRPGARLVELVVVDGVLFALLCGGGRVRRFEVGPVAAAVAEIEFARSRLRRLAYRREPDRGECGELGRRLDASVLGPVAARLGDGPLVIVPPGILHGAPWPLLSSLRHRVFSVAPSAAAWLRARRAVPPEDGAVVLVRGPGMAGADSEVRAIAALYGEATVLAGGSATARNVLSAVDGCRLAHLAAHGTFRADSPLFSSLLVDDGPLTAHDFEGLGRAPHRLVLSSCDSGQMAAVGADEVLGLATALLRLGTAGIVASVVPVNDEAAVPVMVGLHDGLRRGLTLAEALAAARGDDVSFVAIGAG
ncbi:CHAT domain-containing tetratricopeptide repeat protein [Nonomuraea sp. NPDC048916]|uniref:CHAT domain-containing protein n=1 Tax=Nonomuraea sp. NPDC048916 TaxID=3154232 RepID=UPI0033C35292